MSAYDSLPSMGSSLRSSATSSPRKRQSKSSLSIVGQSLESAGDSLPVSTGSSLGSAAPSSVSSRRSHNRGSFPPVRQSPSQIRAALAAGVLYVDPVGSAQQPAAGTRSILKQMSMPPHGAAAAAAAATAAASAASQVSTKKVSFAKKPRPSAQLQAAQQAAGVITIDELADEEEAEGGTERSGNLVTAKLAALKARMAAALGGHHAGRDAGPVAEAVSKRQLDPMHATSLADVAAGQEPQGAGWPEGLDLWGPTVCVVPDQAAGPTSSMQPARLPSAADAAHASASGQPRGVSGPGSVAEAVEGQQSSRGFSDVGQSWEQALRAHVLQLGRSKGVGKIVPLHRSLTLDQRLSQHKASTAPAAGLSSDSEADDEGFHLGYAPPPREKSMHTDGMGQSGEPVLDRGEPTLERTITELQRRQRRVERGRWGGARSASAPRADRGVLPDQAPRQSRPRSLSPLSARFAGSWNLAALHRNATAQHASRPGRGSMRASSAAAGEPARRKAGAFVRGFGSRPAGAGAVVRAFGLAAAEGPPQAGPWAAEQRPSPGVVRG